MSLKLELTRWALRLGCGLVGSLAQEPRAARAAPTAHSASATSAPALPIACVDYTIATGAATRCAVALAKEEVEHGGSGVRWEVARPLRVVAAVPMPAELRIRRAANADHAL